MEQNYGLYLAKVTLVTSLLKLLNKLQEVGKIDNLQQAAATSCCKPCERMFVNRLVATCALVLAV